ncbi:MAG: recombination protein RecR [Chloroflexi bacterium]|nr:recombination protein RecR [Chloroflexota bacterium]
MSTEPFSLAKPLARLIEELHRLPGVGPKTAQRLTYYIVRMPSEDARALAEAIIAVKEKTTTCSACFNVTDGDPCAICVDSRREGSQICVVEDPLDVLALERSGAYKGLYHVLHGAISPVNGIGPDRLKIKELVRRLEGASVEEVVLATNPTLEGEATAMYIYRLLQPLRVKVTRLARGLPVGSDLEYTDEITLTRALEGRQEFHG